MSNFKVGDEVRVLEKADGGDVQVGTVDVITYVGDVGVVAVGNSTCRWFLGVNGGKIELVKPTALEHGKAYQFTNIEDNTIHGIYNEDDHYFKGTCVEWCVS